MFFSCSRYSSELGRVWNGLKKLDKYFTQFFPISIYAKSYLIIHICMQTRENIFQEYAVDLNTMCINLVNVSIIMGNIKFGRNSWFSTKFNLNIYTSQSQIIRKSSKQRTWLVENVDTWCKINTSLLPPMFTRKEVCVQGRSFWSKGKSNFELEHSA